MSGVYKPYKEDCLDSSAPNLTAVDVKEVLVDAADYTVDLTNHDFLADVPAGGRVATSAAYGGKTITGGVFDVTDLNPTFVSVTGDPCEYVIGFVDTGNAATSNLVWINDSGTGLPVSPNGGNINTIHDDGASKVFAL